MQKTAEYRVRSVVVSLKEKILTLLFVLACIVLGLLIYIANETMNRWEEIKFTYDHPSLVKTLRISYASESAKLEESFLKKEKTAEDKLIEAVANEVSLK